MIILRNLGRTCMRLGKLRQSRNSQRVKKTEHFKIKSDEEREATTDSKRRIAELLFDTCTDCKRMAAIPQGAFAACKVRRNLERNIMIMPVEEREKGSKENTFNMRAPLEGWELTPLKYNSKLMNSIWGLYNRYSVHNFKKNNDANDGVFTGFVAACQTIFHIHAPATNSVTATAVTKNNS